MLSSGGATYNHEILSVEHVLPQSPAAGSQWEKWFPTLLERSKYVHKISNLVLLTNRKNSQARNFEFDRKKKEYFIRNGVSPFALTTQVLQETNWDKTVLDKRQLELINTFKTLWRL